MKNNQTKSMIQKRIIHNYFEETLPVFPLNDLDSAGKQANTSDDARNQDDEGDSEKGPR